MPRWRRTTPRIQQVTISNVWGVRSRVIPVDHSPLVEVNEVRHRCPRVDIQHRLSGVVRVPQRRAAYHLRTLEDDRWLERGDVVHILPAGVELPPGETEHPLQRRVHGIGQLVVRFLCRSRYGEVVGGSRNGRRGDVCPVVEVDDPRVLVIGDTGKLGADDGLEFLVMQII
jgi:hypothetical protein